MTNQDSNKTNKTDKNSDSMNKEKILSDPLELTFGEIISKIWDTIRRMKLRQLSAIFTTIAVIFSAIFSTGVFVGNLQNSTVPKKALLQPAQLREIVSVHREQQLLRSLSYINTHFVSDVLLPLSKKQNISKKTGIALAIAAAGLVYSAPLLAKAHAGGKTDLVHCYGVNICGGHND